MKADLATRSAQLRAALTSAGTLRLPGGDALARALDRAAAGDGSAAQASLPKHAPDAALAAASKLLEALLLDSRGKRDAAEEALAAVVLNESSPFDLLCLAGDCFLDWHRPEAARRAYDRAIAIAPHASHAILRRGRAFAAIGDLAAAIDDFRRASLLQPNLLDAHLALGDACRDAAMLESAIAAYRCALDIESDHIAARASLDAAIATLVPPWHTAMLNDRRRNRAFDTAIRRAVARCADARGSTPAEIHVLDIGTGTGLLAMMAARAGAGRITACEAIGPLAEIARDIIDRNGLAGRIEIVHKRSSELAVGEDLPRPADLLVAEIVDAGLINEGILGTIADARARLLAPDATIIPQGAELYAVPIQSAEIAARHYVGEACGFDISPFNALAPRLPLQTDLTRCDWQPLASPAALFSFDFTRDGPDGGEASIRLMPDRDGTAHAVALWFHLALDDETALATGPHDPPTHWQQAVIGLDAPVALGQGEPVRLHARHDGRRMLVGLR